MLVLEGTLFLRRRIEEVLQQHEIGPVWLAGRQSEAREILRKEKPAALVMDVVLPQGDGLRFLRWVRKQHPDLGVVVVTAVSERDIVIECARLAVVDFIAKPFEPARLTEAVRRAMKEASR